MQKGFKHFVKEHGVDILVDVGTVGALCLVFWIGSIAGYMQCEWDNATK